MPEEGVRAVPRRNGREGNGLNLVGEPVDDGKDVTHDLGLRERADQGGH